MPMLLALCMLLLLPACQPKKTAAPVGKQVAKPAATRMVQSYQGAAEIKRLLAQARAGGDVDQIMQQLDRLALSAAMPIREEASFRKAQLMLEGGYPGAYEAAQAVIECYAQHALVPYTHYWIARWWIEQEESDRALEQMRLALGSPKLTGELIDRILDVGPVVTQDADEHEAIAWLLAAANVDLAGRDNWLRMAARRASMDTIEQLIQGQSLSPEILPAFALQAGRSRLMNGHIDEINRIAGLLETKEPAAPELNQLRAWASGEVQQATIGVMLPLTGAFAQYGQQALRGIRIALSGLEYGQYITIRVEDTGSTPEMAVQAYRQLADASVNIIIGPLLVASTEALLPYLKPSIPVISMTGRMDLAHRSDALFVHTLSPLAQVNVMAEYAWQHGAKRMVVISDAAEKQTEAEMFTSAFEGFGGKIVQSLQLAPGTIDYRNSLRRLRFKTDDNRVLAELDRDLNLFMPKMKMEIRMPLNFDAIYLALNGKKVALLAGQMAYADITGAPIYGSSRWQDGHLLDDRGRYLSHARFASSESSDAKGSDSPDMRSFRFAYREAWGDDKISDLMRLAYDTMRLATVITSRLGLENSEIFEALQDADGFPAMTGHVHFDEFGVGQKQLDIFSIKKGKIVPAG